MTVLGWEQVWQLPGLPGGPPYVTACQHRHPTAAVAARCSDRLWAETEGWALLGVHPVLDVDERGDVAAGAGSTVAAWGAGEGGADAVLAVGGRDRGRGDLCVCAGRDVAVPLGPPQLRVLT